MDAGAFEEAGLYDPAAPGAAERLELLEYLASRGATIEQMVEAADALPALAGRLVESGLGQTEPIDRLAARCGTTVERVQRLLLAAGLPADATSELPVATETLVLAFLQGSALMGEEPLLAFTRVLGSAAINMAEAAVALFYSQLGPGSERGGDDDMSRAHMAERATYAFNAVPGAFTRVLMVQFDRAVRRASVSRGSWALEGRDLDRASERVALGFVDLVDSTAWGTRLDLRDQSLALSRFESVAWSSAVLADGRVVKMIGDEAFFAAPSVEGACRIATEVVAAAAADPVLPPARGAVGFGSASSREGDYFGPLVNLVGRLVKTAHPGSVLVTAEAAAELAPGRWPLQPLDPVVVRGIDHPVAAFELGQAGDG